MNQRQVKDGFAFFNRASTPVKALIITVLILGAVGYFVLSTKTGPKETEPLPPPPSAQETVSILEQLDVKEKLPSTVYDRSSFGSAWKDVDKNGCDTRNDILRRDLTETVYEPGSDCVITKGLLADPYTGKLINFVKGHGALVDIDHIVALGNVAVSSGDSLSSEERESIANDPLNLIAVDAPANRAKSDKDASEWLPVEDFQCEYVTRQIQVKSKYGLSVTESEKSAILEALGTC
jgi:hypothetical protein